MGHVFPFSAGAGTAREARAAFEHFYVAKYGPPNKRLRSGMETIPGTDDAFLWVESHPDHPDLAPNYYYTDVAEKWVAFLAGWVAVADGRPGAQAADFSLLGRYAGNW